MPKPIFSSQGHALDRSITWDITISRFHLTPTQKRKRVISIKFKVKNNSGKRLTVRIQFNSLSRVIQFSSKKFKVLGKTRVHEETTSNTSVQKQNLPSEQIADFTFRAYYLPQLAHQSYSHLAFEYSVAAFDQEGKIVTHSEPRQILLPLMKKT